MMWLAGFMVGAIVGSAISSLTWRLPKGMSWVKGKSVCPQCKHPLGVLELIPILSWLLLLGKCRYCRKPFGTRYLVVELLTASGLALIFVNGFTIPSLLLAGMLALSMVVAVMDWETMLVSEMVVGLWVLLALAYQITTGNFNIINVLLSIGIGVGMIGGLWAATRKQAMGFGDVEIAIAMGVMLSWPQMLIALWMAFVSGAIVGSFRLVTQQAKMRSLIAFGPFLVLGTWVAYAFGDTIILWLNFHF